MIRGAFFALALASMVACATPGGKALDVCELGLLPQSLEAVAVEVAAIASNSAQWEQDLAALSTKVGPDQFGCVVQAVEIALAGGAKAAPGTTLPPERALAVGRLRTWLSKHPGCCASHT